MNLRRFLVLGAACMLLGPRVTAAQQFPLSAAEVADSGALATSMPRLAAQVLAEYRDTSRVRYLDNRFRLDMLLARYADAARTLATLRQVRQDTTAATRALNVQYEILSAAMTAPVEAPFAERFVSAFRAR